MKIVLTFLAALFLFAAGAQPVEAQTRTIRHPATGLPAMSVDVPDGWTSTVDKDNNLILASPSNRTAFSMSVGVDNSGLTLDGFGQAVLKSATVTGVTNSGQGMLPPYEGNTYLGKLTVNGSSLNVKMIVVQMNATSFVSATLVSSPAATTEEMAVAEMVLKTVRVLR